MPKFWWQHAGSLNQTVPANHPLYPVLTLENMSKGVLVLFVPPQRANREFDLSIQPLKQTEIMVLEPTLFKWRGCIVFQSHHADKTCSSKHILVSFQVKLLGNFRECRESLNFDLTLFVSKNQCTWTNTVLPQYLKSVQGHFLLLKNMQN